MGMKWEVETFVPSDGRDVAGGRVDHQAWLRGVRDDAAWCHMLVQFSSRDIPTENADRIVQSIVSGLNAK